VTTLRHFLMRHAAIAMALVVLALLMKMLVPTGYMIGASSRSFTIELCSGSAPIKVVLPMHGMVHETTGQRHQDSQHHQGKEMQPCAFSGLSATSLGGTDSVLLATAILFVLSTVFRVSTRAVLPDAPDYLRPPMRGPPAHT
jgi:hypothetical protein